jgi:hypothetical protein
MGDVEAAALLAQRSIVWRTAAERLGVPEQQREQESLPGNGSVEGRV